MLMLMNTRCSDADRIRRWFKLNEGAATAQSGKHQVSWGIFREWWQNGLWNLLLLRGIGSSDAGFFYWTPEVTRGLSYKPQLYWTSKSSVPTFKCFTFPPVNSTLSNHEMDCAALFIHYFKNHHCVNTVFLL